MRQFLKLDQPAKQQDKDGDGDLLAGISAEEAEKLAKELDEADGRVSSTVSERKA